MPILFDNYQVATLDKPAIVNTYSLTDSWVNQRDGKNWSFMAQGVKETALKY